MVLTRSEFKQTSVDPTSREKCKKNNIILIDNKLALFKEGHQLPVTIHTGPYDGLGDEIAMEYREAKWNVTYKDDRRGKEYLLFSGKQE